MSDVVRLEWTFTPPDYFEEARTIAVTGHSIVIDNGKAEARIDIATYDADRSIRARLHEALNAHFLAAAVMKHRRCELHRSTVEWLWADGRRGATAEIEGFSVAIATSSLNFVVRDKDGNVKSDSRRERIDGTNAFADSVASHWNDDLLRALIASYNAAVNDPPDELLHLYEIRDALARKFPPPGKRLATLLLGISDAQWNRFHELCCDLPLRQGRHRGSNILALRDATVAELSEARGIARSLIAAYLRTL